MFQRILVPLDGSLRAERALPIAAQIARASGGSLHLLQVELLPTDFSGGFSPAPLITQASIDMEITEAIVYLKNVASTPALASLPTTVESLFGEPARTILAVAHDRGIDLIVLCSHGRTGFARWALGSVAHMLVHQSLVPVLVIRQQEGPVPIETARSFRTLVPLDGSALAEAALAPAEVLTEALAAPAQGVLHLVQVIKDAPSPGEESFVSERNEEACQRARSYLATVTERMESTAAGHALAITSSVERASDVASALLGVAEQENTGGCDLIAISTHGRGGLERWVMGSVTERLLTATKLPLLIVRPQHKE